MSRLPLNLLDSGEMRDVIGTSLTLLATNSPDETSYVMNITGNYDGTGEAELSIYGVEPEGTSVGGATSAHTFFGPESMYPPDHHTFHYGLEYPGIIMDTDYQSIQAQATITDGGYVTIGLTGAKE